MIIETRFRVLRLDINHSFSFEFSMANLRDQDFGPSSLVQSRGIRDGERTLYITMQAILNRI
jgi:hypothetical protein